MRFKIVGGWLFAGWLTFHMIMLQAATVLFLADVDARSFPPHWPGPASETRSVPIAIIPQVGGALRGFLEAIPQGSVPTPREGSTLAALCRQPPIDAVVAFGWEVARTAARECGKPLLAVRVSRQQFSLGLDSPPPVALSAIYLEADPRLDLSLIRALLPEARTVGILKPALDPAWLPSLRDEARRMRLEPIEIAVADDLDAARALRTHLAGLDAVLLPPDPTLINEWSLKPLLLMTVRQGVPTFGGLTARYVEAGVLAAVVADEERLLEQVRRFAADLARGHPPAPAYPTAVRVAVNPTVARTLGLSAEAVERARSLLLRP